MATKAQCSSISFPWTKRLNERKSRTSQKALQVISEDYLDNDVEQSAVSQSTNVTEETEVEVVSATISA